MSGNAAPPRGLLAVFAHPDDETFGVGGTLALAVLACHANQMGGRDWNEAPRELLVACLGAETFIRAAPAPPRDLRESTLFGLDPVL